MALTPRRRRRVSGMLRSVEREPERRGHLWAIAFVSLGSLVAVSAVALSAGTAAAKGLPVTSVEVTTAKPTVGKPIEVIVRFGRGFDLADAEWENWEVSVVPKAETDAHGWPSDPRGWPSSATFRGVPVRLRHIGTGTYRGSVVIRRPGDYTVVDWSHVHAADAFRADITDKHDYLAPVPLHVASAVPALSRHAHPTARSSLPLPAAWFIGAIAFAGVGGTSILRARSRRRGALSAVRAA